MNALHLIVPQNEIYSFYISSLEQTMKPLLLAFRKVNSRTGITRDRLQALAAKLGMTETQTIHHALAELARRELPSYEADDEDVTDEQYALIHQLVDQTSMKVEKSLFGAFGGIEDDMESTGDR